MTIEAHAQTRADLDVADRIVRACWDNFKAREPTFVLRDLIAIELAKTREAERMACAAIAKRKGYDCRGDDFGPEHVGEIIHGDYEPQLTHRHRRCLLLERYAGV